MTGTRKRSIKDPLPRQEGKSCQGRLADRRKNGEGKGVRAQPGGRGVQKLLGSAQGADRVPVHGGTSITQIELPVPLQHPCPARKRAKRKPRTAEGNLPPEQGRGRQVS